MYGSDLVHRSQQLKFMSNSLNSKALVSYVPLIVKEAEDYFAKWGNTGVRYYIPHCVLSCDVTQELTLCVIIITRW